MSFAITHLWPQRYFINIRSLSSSWLILVYCAFCDISHTHLNRRKSVLITGYQVVATRCTCAVTSCGKRGSGHHIRILKKEIKTFPSSLYSDGNTLLKWVPAENRTTTSGHANCCMCIGFVDPCGIHVISSINLSSWIYLISTFHSYAYGVVVDCSSLGS